MFWHNSGEFLGRIEKDETEKNIFVSVFPLFVRAFFHPEQKVTETIVRPLDDHPLTFVHIVGKNEFQTISTQSHAIVLLARTLPNLFFPQPFFCFPTVLSIGHIG